MAVNKGRSSTKGTPKCHESHQPLRFDVNDKTYEVAGGSCTNLLSTDYDVIVGLDRGMCPTNMVYPWTNGVQFLYPVTDMSAPASSKSFKKLIQWLWGELQAGKRVFVGCIGGHGRTGTVLAALVAHATGEADAIEYVRKHYCTRAVESESQIKFLVKHYGVEQAKPAKTPLGYSTGKGKTLFDYGLGHIESPKAPSKAKSQATFVPMESPLSIHGN